MDGDCSCKIYWLDGSGRKYKNVFISVCSNVTVQDINTQQFVMTTKDYSLAVYWFSFTFGTWYKIWYNEKTMKAHKRATYIKLPGYE